MTLLATLLVTWTLTWTAPHMRVSGELLAAEDIQLFTVYRNGIEHDHTSGTELAITRPRKGCDDYTVTATDNYNLESDHSDPLRVCKKRRRKVK